ncbi:MAG: PDZ domain-containing protein, partial [Nitrososphaerales archaeon]
TPKIAEAMNLPEAKGFLIIQVIPGSPAEKAGLRGGDRQLDIDGLTVVIGGDVILGVDDIDARKLNDLLLYTERYKSPGDTVTFNIFREGRTQSVDLVLGERPPPG